MLARRIVASCTPLLRGTSVAPAAAAAAWRGVRAVAPQRHVQDGSPKGWKQLTDMELDNRVHVYAHMALPGGVERWATELPTIEAKTRVGYGRRFVREMREQGLVPAVAFGGTEEKLLLSLQRNMLVSMIQNRGFMGRMYWLNIDNGVKRVLVTPHQLHREAVSLLPQNVTFYRETEKQATLERGDEITICVGSHEFNVRDSK